MVPQVWAATVYSTRMAEPKIRKAVLPVLVEARPHSVKATGQLLEGSGMGLLKGRLGKSRCPRVLFPTLQLVLR